MRYLAANAAVTVLLGWFADSPALQGRLGQRVSMNPVTAAAFLTAAASLWILCGIEAGPAWRSRKLAQFLAVFVICLGAQRILEARTWFDTAA